MSSLLLAACCLQPQPEVEFYFITRGCATLAGHSF